MWSGQRPSWLWRVDGAAWRIVAQGVANQCALLLTRPTPNADRQAWSSYSRAQPAAKQIVAACKWVRDEDSLPGRNRSLRLPEPVKQVAVESENSASLASSVPFACIALLSCLSCLSSRLMRLWRSDRGVVRGRRNVDEMEVLTRNGKT